ncbi:uncharacterized protein PGTG_07520 [Puccinia graminis f. sp. tritici CRL 75-36-700-3]|uniref:Uncharacterized protein n=1 Tax=Puccinia graminis f. sp. tritici (strain CRL 75-36-700-3 / race SCCL) TaxID=418459 RepID=E3KDA8_PUCGT|nr:uncharacterized protein PGTG_07520 [Puccinia graminis f. sp. tritici CRL 75-36-700-3]EFP82123.1 hypothetical protein PGTG_07520 [Puccinia graminis f. sp. tritici CRL 75-36-700-3]
MFGTSIRMSSRVARLTTSLLEYVHQLNAIESHAICAAPPSHLTFDVFRFFGSMSSVLCTQADIAHIAFDLSRSMIVVLNFCPRGVATVSKPNLKSAPAVARSVVKILFLKLLTCAA